MDYILGKMPNRPELPPITWNPDAGASMNPHMLICAASGAGKTTLLLDIAKYITKRRKHCYIFDLKGDMVILDDDGQTQLGNYIEFTSWDSDYGINPFEFDTGVPEKELKEIIANDCVMDSKQSYKIRNSGPKVQIERFIEIVKKNYLPNMSTNQKDMLSYLLMDTYAMRGFAYNDIKTWVNELPTLNDTLYLIKRIKSLADNYDGGVLDEESTEYLMALQKDIVELKLSITGKNDEQEEIILDDIESIVLDNDNKDSEDENEEPIKTKKKKQKIKEIAESIEYIASDDNERIKKIIHEKLDSFINFGLNNFSKTKCATNREWFETYKIDSEKYMTKDAMKTIIKLASYILGLIKSGAFHDKKPPVKNGLNIVNISGLEVPIQRFIVDVWLGKVFKACKIRGTYKELPNRERGAKCDTYVIIDESKLISGNNKEKKDPFSYLNRIATEARGYGFGIIVAAQSAEHFPPEFVKNFDAQIMLNTTIADFEAVKKSFGIDKAMLEYTQHGFGNALIKTGRNFVKVKLDLKPKLLPE